jgi:[NiFe] hydrogenase assembly HybE family chaperone
MSRRFEGSYLGDAGKIADGAVLECKICWHVYDPAVGDDVRQIAPGTPFSALPDDWRCPACDGARDQFMVVDGGSAAAAAAGTPPSLETLAATQARLLAETFRDIHHNKMRDTPFINRSLSVEAVGFRAWQGRILGMLITPWFMNLIVMPGAGEDWSRFQVGEKRVFGFASGDYEFIFNARPPVGAYFSCGLFSPMTEFSSQLQAQDTARAALAALFDEAHREQTDRGEEVRQIREAELLAAEAAQARPAVAAEPTRRGFITGGMAGTPDGAAG